MCQNNMLLNNLAFTYEFVDDEGKIVTEGVCGDCAEWNAWNRKNLESFYVKIVAENWHKVALLVFDVETVQNENFRLYSMWN